MTGAPEPPLCVDLDGTLIEGDTLRISLRHLLVRRPWVLLAVPFVLLRGRPAMKAFVAGKYVPDPARLSWRPEILAFLRDERTRGRRIVLATAANRRIAEAVASYLGLFDAIVATDLGANLKGPNKATQIRKSLACNEFDYMGDSSADLPVFRAARLSYLVDATPSVREAALSQARVAREFPARPGTGRRE